MKQGPKMGDPGAEEGAQRHCRLLALIPAALWVGSLVAPVHFRMPHGFLREGVGPGWWLLTLGWLGPLGLSVAWYANIPFIVSIIRMARGNRPRFRTALTAILLAPTTVVPFYIMDFERAGYIAVYAGGPAVWLWLASFALLFGMVDWAAPEPWEEIESARLRLEISLAGLVAGVPRTAATSLTGLRIVIIILAAAVSLGLLLVAVQFVR